MDEARERVRAIAKEFLGRGDATGWFEQVYATANFDLSAIPWVDSKPNRSVVRWLDREAVEGGGARALVVGCGLGDDAEELLRRGFDVTAFDISSTAVEWCQRRFPGSAVSYVAADLLAPPSTWDGAFDFVLEVFTLQTLRDELRAAAIRNLARFVAPRGRLLIICRARDVREPAGDLPWPLHHEELDAIQSLGLREVAFEDFLDDDDPPVRRFRALYQRESR